MKHHTIFWIFTHAGMILKDGMVIAFEPFISTLEEEVFQSEDGWTFLTDESFVAQYEHTIIITKKGPIITTL